MDFSGFRNGNGSKTPLEYNDTVVALESLGIDAVKNDENYSDLESEEDDDHNIISKDKNLIKPKYNEWKGQEVGLYLLGQFNSEFDRSIKSNIRPEIVDLKLDPFCRNDYPQTGDPGHGNAYRIWKNSHIPVTAPTVNEGKIPISEEPQEQFAIKKENENPGSTEIDEDDDDDPLISTIVGYEPFDVDSSESETETEISEFIASLKIKKRDGTSLTGETLWYDESKDMIRNFHTKSYSLTSYVPPDNNLFGKGNILKSILTVDELKVLQPLEAPQDEDNC